jgi:hypothetical protein
LAIRAHPERQAEQANQTRLPGAHFANQQRASEKEVNVKTFAHAEQRIRPRCSGFCAAETARILATGSVQK